MPKNRKSEMYLDDIVRFLQEADEDQQQMPPVPGNEQGGIPGDGMPQGMPQDDQQLDNMNLGGPGDPNGAAPEDNPEPENADNENPDDAMGNDTSTSDDKAIESTKDDVMDIINKSLKAGKKVNISISNESKVSGVSDNVSKIYQEIAKLKSKKEIKGGLSPEDERKLKKLQEKLLRESTYAIDLNHTLSNRVNELEEELEGKSILDSFYKYSKKGKINRFNEAIEEFDKSIREYENLMESYGGPREYSILKNAYSEITSDISKYRDAINECAANAKISMNYFNILRENNIINESAIIASSLYNKIKNTQEAMLESENAMEVVKDKMNNSNNVMSAMMECENTLGNLISKLDFLTEESAMSLDAVGFDKSMKDTYYEAPEYVQKKYGSAANTYPKSDLSEVVDSKGYIDKKYSSFYKLPLAKNAETGKLSTNSAMSAIAEAFTDETGILNCNAVAPAFLYQKTRSPKTINDFSFPIGAMEEGSLVVVPKFVEDTVKLLENDVALSKIYKIPETEIDAIRSRLVPYMEELHIEIPWD